MVDVAGSCEEVVPPVDVVDELALVLAIDAVVPVDVEINGELK